MADASSPGGPPWGDDPLQQHSPPQAAPALTIVAAVSVGMLIDRGTTLPAGTWESLLVACVAVAAVCQFRKKSRVLTAVLLIGLASLGGLRHHARWHYALDSNVAAFARPQSIPVRLVGVLDSPVAILSADDDRFAPEWMQLDRSIAELDCRQLLYLNGEVTPLIGRVRLEVSGHLEHVRVGDRVSILGHLQRPSPAANPGGFDFQTWLRERGFSATLRVNHPDAVARIESRVTWEHQLARVRDRLRTASRRLLVRELSPDSVPVAVALLLGDRSQVTDADRDIFTRSGTMHLLAISGLHVGVLVGLVLFFGRLLNLSPVVLAVTVGTIVVSYAFLTDHRASVVRACVFTVLVIAAGPWSRRVSPINTIALCALVVLLWQPTDLFDVGAQLSFLAVAAIVWSASLWRGRRTFVALSSGGNVPLHGPAGRRLHAAYNWLTFGYLVTAAVWLWTLPLAVFRFHLVSPVGFLLNVLLMPVVGALMACGFLTLGVGLLVPPLAFLPATVFDLLLRGMLWVIESAAGTPLGHHYLGGPPAWWVLTFYLLLVLASGVVGFVRSRRWLWRGLAVWGLLGLSLGLLPTRSDGLRCRFLAVGHGAAVVLQLPGGQTLLYDAGTFGSGRRASSIVQGALWADGISRVDAIVVSHADVDHFNGVAGLLETTPVGTVLLHRSFLDFEQLTTRDLCEAAFAADVPIQLLQQGDRLTFTENGQTVTIEVRHPAPTFHNAADNPNSIVLHITYAGRSILLTGDIEDAGLAELIAQDIPPIDIMLAPHHGSRAANPQALADWAQPQHVIISTADREATQPLAAIYAPWGEVHSTADRGAVTVTIDPQGQLDIEQYNF